MTTKKRNRKNMSVKDILKGKFLVDDNAFSNWWFIFFIVFLLLVMVSSNHWIDQKIHTISTIKEELNEYKAKYINTESKLIKLKLESELVSQMEADSIFPLENHPIKIVIPHDAQ